MGGNILLRVHGAAADQQGFCLMGGLGSPSLLAEAKNSGNERRRRLLDPARPRPKDPVIS